MADILLDPKDVAITDGLALQATYAFRALDEKGSGIEAGDFGGVSPYLPWRFPPQAIQIQRSIRGEVIRDIGSGFAVTSGGEGIGRITIQATHGAGKLLSPSKVSAGLNFRNAFTTFFEAFTRTNDERGKLGKPLLQMAFEVVDGKFSNPAQDRYLVWPQSFPVDTREASRPHAWSWTLVLDILSVLSESGPVLKDDTKVITPKKAKTKLEKLLDLFEKALKIYKQVKEIIQKIKDVINKIKKAINAIKKVIAGIKEFIYKITDIIRSVSQACRSLLKALSPKDFKDDVKTDLRGALGDARRTCGQIQIMVAQFRRGGDVPAVLSPRQTASLLVPVAVAVSPGDTLQSLAARHLGSASRWPDLLSINDLDFPYVDFSGPNGAPDPAYAGMNVLGAGGTLKLPLPAAQTVVGISRDPFGTDLLDDGALGTANTLQGGVANLSAALIRRLITPAGRIPNHPAYGSRLKLMLGGATTDAHVESIKAEVIRCCLQDSRIFSVESVEAQVSDAGAVEVTVACRTPTGGLSFSSAVA